MIASTPGAAFAAVVSIDLILAWRVRRTQHDAIGHAGNLHVVGIVPGAAHQPRILETRNALADCELTHRDHFTFVI